VESGEVVLVPLDARSPTRIGVVTSVSFQSVRSVGEAQ
jgi:hypothetical protein